MAKWVQKDKDNNVVAEVEIFDPVAHCDDDVLAITITEKQIVRSDFPHPLVTIDYAEDGSVASVEFVGPVKKAIENPLRLPGT